MKKSLTTEERKELSKLDRSFRYHVIKGSRLWKYFSPFKVNDLLKIYDNCNPENNKCSNNQDFIIKKGYGKMILIKKRN